MKPIQFLERVHPDRPWILTAIEPSQKGIETRAFLPDQKAEAKKWIDANNGKRNLYWSVAEVLEPEDKKAGIENVKSVHYLHVDIDAGAGDLLAELDRIKKLVTEKLPAGAVEPSIIIYSGGGYQAFWALEEPLIIEGNTAVAEEAARYNKQLELLFGGDSCSNVDRIMRLPGTMNIPNQRKVAKGRVPVEAAVLEFRDTTYPISTFAQAADVGRTGEAVDVEISGNIQRLTSIDDLDQWNVPDRVKVICVQGRDPEEPKEGDDSRSAWLFDGVCNLVRCGVPDQVVYSVITDPGFKIAESVLEASNSDRYAKKQIKSAKEAVESSWLHKLNSTYAVIGNLGGRCLVVEEVYDEAMKRQRLVKQTFSDFQNRYRNQYEETTDAKGNVKLVPVGKWWLDHPKRRQYDRLVFEPSRDVPGVYNLWRGFAFNSLPGEQHKSFLKHIYETVCCGNQEHYRYLVGWLARTVQHPDVPGHTAVVMRGRPGTGKSFMAKHVGRLFGRHFLHVSNAAHLVGNFNSHLRDAIVLFADEAFYAGDKKHEGVLKTLVTEETLLIEAKGVDAEVSPNFTHLIMASNSNWVVPVGAGDRRYFVVDVDETYARDVKHFGAIARDLENGGYQNLLYYLMNYDLSEYNVQDIPHSTARQDQHDETLAPHEEWWLSRLEEGHLGGESWPMDEALSVSNPLVMEDYERFVHNVSTHRKLTGSGIGRYLSRILPGDWPELKKMRVDGHPTWCRIVPCLEEARAEWDRISGSSRQWHDVSLMSPDDDLPF